MESPFFGRQRELEILSRMKKKKTASMAVIKGRRRIGKSRLIKEFCKGQRSYTFVGLAPNEKTTAQSQRDDFALQMERLLNVPALQYARDWGDLFWRLSQYVQSEPLILVFDEINWMGSKDPTFLGKLKTAWDEVFKTNSQLILVLSGSMSIWIEENILKSTAFLGRVSPTITLDELPLHRCHQFWGVHKQLMSNYEKLKVLSVTGGIPRYLEEVDPSISANENILRLCFEPEGLLFHEFEKVFSDLFTRSGASYRKILTCLAEGPLDYEGISNKTGLSKGGFLSDCLEHLVITGYVANDETWSLSKGVPGKLRQYRLKDNYIRFYLRFIEPNKHRIEKQAFDRPPAWDSVMGLQFENLVLNNAKALQRLLRVSPSEIVFENPFFQRQTKIQRGCQIDYLIQTQHKILYVCEIKFSREKIGAQVIEEVQEKIARMSTPKNFSFIPVLIHVNGVTDTVIERGFFGRTIDFGELLTPVS